MKILAKTENYFSAIIACNPCSNGDEYIIELMKTINGATTAQLIYCHEGKEITLDQGYDENDLREMETEFAALLNETTVALKKEVIK